MRRFVSFPWQWARYLSSVWSSASKIKNGDCCTLTQSCTCGLWWGFRKQPDNPQRVMMFVCEREESIFASLTRSIIPMLSRLHNMLSFTLFCCLPRLTRDFIAYVVSGEPNGPSSTLTQSTEANAPRPRVPRMLMLSKGTYATPNESSWDSGLYSGKTSSKRRDLSLSNPLFGISCSELLHVIALIEQTEFGCIFVLVKNASCLWINVFVFSHTMRFKKKCEI